MNNRKQWIIRAKRTVLGRTLCRLMGDNTGAVMMEYVVLALLICAAVVGIVMIFGDSISSMFAASAATLTGDEGVTDAKEIRDQQVTRNKGKSSKDELKDSRKMIHGQATE